MTCLRATTQEAGSDFKHGAPLPLKTTLPYISKRNKNTCPRKNCTGMLMAASVTVARRQNDPHAQRLRNGYTKCVVSMQWNVSQQ